MNGEIFVVAGIILTAIALGFWLGELGLKRKKSVNAQETRPVIEAKDGLIKPIQPDTSSVQQVSSAEFKRMVPGSINRLYTFYNPDSLAAPLGPSEIVFCRFHAKNFIREVGGHSARLRYSKGPKVTNPCDWCANPGDYGPVKMRKNINRIYNVYLARSIRESISGPKTYIVLCKDHYKRYKELLKQDPVTHVLKGQRTESPCWWCENPDEVEKLWGES